MAFIRSEDEPFSRQRIVELRDLARDAYNDLEVALAIVYESKMKRLTVSGAASIKTMETAARAARKFHDAALIAKAKSDMKKRSK